MIFRYGKSDQIWIFPYQILEKHGFFHENHGFFHGSGYQIHEKLLKIAGKSLKIVHFKRYFTIFVVFELELERILSQMTQKPMLRG